MNTILSILTRHTRMLVLAGATAAAAFGQGDAPGAIRGVVTRTLARPNPQDMLPVRQVNDDTHVITDGNPNLDVTESINYDLVAAHYLKPLGVFSAGVFQKDIEVNNITDSSKRSYQGDPSNPRSVRYFDWAVNFRLALSL